jgi:hypothetical protein
MRTKRPRLRAALVVVLAILAALAAYGAIRAMPI